MCHANDVVPCGTNEKSESFAFGFLAGTVGLEPTNGGVKVRCLTAWLRPNIFTTLILYYILAFLSISNIEKQGNMAAIFSQNTTSFFQTDNEKSKKSTLLKTCLFKIYYFALKVTVISVPTSSVLSSEIFAPWNIAPCLTIASPSPVPPTAFERPLSTL